MPSPILFCSWNIPCPHLFCRCICHLLLFRSWTFYSQNQSFTSKNYLKGCSILFRSFSQMHTPSPQKIVPIFFTDLIKHLHQNIVPMFFTDAISISHTSIHHAISFFFFLMPSAGLTFLLEKEKWLGASPPNPHQSFL